MGDNTLDTLSSHYNEDSDDDFDPNAAAAAAAQDHESSSEDEDETSGAAVRSHPRSKKPSDDADERLDFDNSGDELTISTGKKTRKKRKNEAQHDLDDEEGGEAGFVRTRAQRRAEAIERKPLVDSADAKVDVNALWAQMSNAGGTTAASASPTSPSEAPPKSQQIPASQIQPSASDQGTTAPPVGQDLVTIKRKYDFAGQTIEEERQVLASSAEAKLFLEQQSRVAPTTVSASRPATNRPKKRKTPFADFAAETSSSSPASRGKKLNTLEKSKLDWAAHVDKEGMTEELDEASKAKGSYLGKVGFLDRMSAKREGDLRDSKR